MRTINVFDKGEHVLMEMEISKVEFEGGVHKYSLKVASSEDYLSKKYVAEQLIPMDTEGME